jgi:hypothetical protein
MKARLVEEKQGRWKNYRRLELEVRGRSETNKMGIAQISGRSESGEEKKKKKKRKEKEKSLEEKAERRRDQRRKSR